MALPFARQILTGLWCRRARRPLRSPSPRISRCPAARGYSRAYLHHLVRANEMLGAILLTTINVAYYQDLMAALRRAIAAGCFAALREELREGWARGDLPPRS